MRGLVLLLLAATVYAQQRDSGCGNPYFMIGFQGEFTSMNFDPDNNIRYDHNAYCDWLIETSSAQDQVIELDFLHHSIEGSVNCVYDSFTSYDGLDNTAPTLRMSCGHSLPNPTHSTGRLMYAEFVSDGSVSYTGFHCSWHTRDRPIECGHEIEYHCGDDVSGYCIPIEERCDGVEDCPEGEDEDGCPTNSVNCGRPAITPNTTIGSNGEVSIDIIGGWEATLGSWPWMAALQRSFDHACGAVILDNNWVATAAHCVALDQLNPPIFDIVTGNHIYTQPDPFEAVFDIDEIFVHPEFSMFKEDFNIALLKVRGRILFLNDHTLDVCLPPSDTLYPDNTEAWITGWGVETLGEEGENAVLLQANVDIYSKDFCNDPSRYNGELHESLMCAGALDGSVDACLGDDGGPLVYHDLTDDKWVLAGITSVRDNVNCGTVGLPGLYMDVSEAIDWIEETMFFN